MPRMADYEPAEAWVKGHWEELQRSFPGKYLYMDARTLLYVIAADNKQAGEQWADPPHEGRRVFGITIPAVPQPYPG